MLDQINKACHDSYKKGKKEYKKQHKAKYGEEPDIGVPEFLEIFGGCADLNLSGIWFSWVTRTSIVGAWRNVGVLGRTTDGSQISRAAFVDRVAEEQKAAEEATVVPVPSPARQARLKRSIAEIAKTPPGVRSGSLAAEKAKCAALAAHVQLQQGEIERLEALPFDPSKVPGLLDPKPHEVRKRARSQARASQSEGGSATIRDLYSESQANKKKREDEAKRLETVRDDRAAKKRTAAETAAQLAADFARCPGKGKCSGCGVSPCPMESFELCEFCPEPVPKRGKCKVRACVEARKRAEQPLMIMGPA